VFVAVMRKRKNRNFSFFVGRKYVVGFGVIGLLISMIWIHRQDHDGVSSLLVVRKGEDCPEFEHRPIMYSREAASRCLNVSRAFLERVQNRINRDVNMSVKGRELLEGRNVFSPRHDKHDVHLGDSYDIKLPLELRPPNRAHQINITIKNLLNTTDRIVQAALPLEHFPVRVERFFESTRQGCENLHDSSPVLWISSPNGISSTHYDRSMNLVVGIYGTKSWSLWDPRYVERMGIAPWLSLRYQQIQHRKNNFENSIDLKLSRGEVLYVPPFWAHRVRSSPTDVVVALSVLFPSHVEERLSKAYFKIQIFLERWNRNEKLAAVYLFLNILIKTLKISSPDDGSTPFPIIAFRDADDFISNVLSRRYHGFKPLTSSHDEDLIQSNCGKNKKLEKNALQHFRDTSREFATRMWGLKSNLCGGSVSLESSIVWLNLGNLVEELILFAVDNDVDALVTVLTKCHTHPD